MQKGNLKYNVSRIYEGTAYNTFYGAMRQYNTIYPL